MTENQEIENVDDVIVDEGNVEHVEETVNEEVVEENLEASGDNNESNVVENEQPAYTPDFTYKVNKEVREIPEHYRSFITDAEREKELRDIMERADGIYDVKEHRDRLTGEINDTYKPAYEIMNQANEYLSNNDLASFFDFSGIKDEDVFKYALKRLELRDNPEQLKANDEFRRVQHQNMQLQKQVESLRTDQQTNTVSHRMRELDQALGGTENLAVVQAYDAQVGTPGAFRAEIIRRGQYYHNVENRDAGVEELVAEVSAPFRGFVNPAPKPQSNVTPSGVVTDGGNQRQKPTLPKVQGRGGTPIKKAVRNLDDLMKIRAEKLGIPYSGKS